MRILACAKSVEILTCEKIASKLHLKLVQNVTGSCYLLDLENQMTLKLLVETRVKMP